MMDDSTYDDLVLMMLYIRSWEEKYSQGFRFSWKGFDFNSLDRWKAGNSLRVSIRTNPRC